MSTLSYVAVLRPVPCLVSLIVIHDRSTRPPFYPILAQIDFRNVNAEYLSSSVQSSGGAFEFGGGNRRNSAGTVGGGKGAGMGAWVRLQLTEYVKTVAQCVSVVWESLLCESIPLPLLILCARWD